MTELLELMRRVSPVADGDEGSVVDAKAREFIEALTFAEPEEILAALREIGTRDLLAVPVWARNLAYRLAVLQRPDDADLLREAAMDLYFVGPDWDHVAAGMEQRAERMKEAK